MSIEELIKMVNELIMEYYEKEIWGNIVVEFKAGKSVMVSNRIDKKT